MDENATHLKLAKFSRYLGRISAATRVVGIIIVIAGIITMLFSLLGSHRTDDTVAFLLIGLAVGGIGVLVWSTGVFHGAVAHGLVVFGWVDGKLWEIMSALKQQAAAAPKAAAPARVQAAAPIAATAAVTPAEVPTASGPSQSATPAAEQPSPTADAAAPAKPNNATESATPPVSAEPAAAATPAPVEAPPPATKRCKHCGAEIPANVLRCKFCLERV